MEDGKLSILLSFSVYATVRINSQKAFKPARQAQQYEN
jgi:hypothetical protein